jgi:ABC-type lipopolysaccharide export system ATPase subunit
MSIEVNNISKSYGAKSIRQHFIFKKGEIVGFLGPMELENLL